MGVLRGCYPCFAAVVGEDALLPTLLLLPMLRGCCPCFAVVADDEAVSFLCGLPLRQIPSLRLEGWE